MSSEVAATYENGVLKLDKPLTLADGERVLVRAEPLIDRTAQKIFYHYCSVDAFLGIIRDGTFRLSNVWFMNDHKEVRWFYGMALEIIGDRLRKRPRRTEACDAAEEYLKKLRHYLQKQREFEHVYCACFSANPDDLSQWRGYADEARGVAIGFDLDDISELPDNKPGVLRRFEVEYCEARQREMAADLIDRFGDPSVCSYAYAKKNPLPQAWKAYYDLSRIAPRCKNPSFQSEQETRLILQPPDASNVRDPVRNYELSARRFPFGKVDFQVRRGKIIPFARIIIPTTSIKEVVFGPRFGRRESEAGMKMFLAAHKVDLTSVTMRKSEASYRQ